MMKNILLFITVFFCHVLGVQAQHVPFLISNGAAAQSDGSMQVHISIGEPVLVAHDADRYIGLGFLEALSFSVPCPVGDQDCLCERNPTDPKCAEFALDDFSFLIDNNEFLTIPPRTVPIEGAFDLTVFNRWGKLEFSTTTLGEQITSWDGSDQEGILLPNGVYYYVIEHPDCKKDKCKGSVTILR